MAGLRTGIVGCGVLTERLLPHFFLPDMADVVTVAALADPAPDRARMLAERHEIGGVYDDLDSMIAGAELDALLVASPIPIHAEQVRSGLEAGLHVHTQKTLATDAETSRDLVELAGRLGLRLAVSPGQMLLPAFMRTNELIENGAIGRPFAAVAINTYYGHEIEAEREGGPTPDPGWYYRPGGGPLADMGIYSIHALIGLFGPPAQVVSFATRPVGRRRWGDEMLDVEVDDNIQVLMRFDGGVLASLATSYSAEPAILRWGHLAITGDEGAIEVVRSSDLRGYDVHHRTRSGTSSEYHDHGLTSAHEELAEVHVFKDVLDFLQAIGEGREPGASAADAYVAVAILDAVERSAASGRAEPPAVD